MNPYTKEQPATYISATATVNNEVSMTFEQVKENVKANESFTVEQTNEIISKINEMEKILKDSKTKKERWDKLKPILDWLSPQGVLTALQVLPLIIDILK